LECILTSLHYSQFNRRWALAIVLVAIGFASYLGWHYIDGTAPTKATEVYPAIPVTVAQAKTADFPVYLTGLGTVEPFVTVTVRSRVDGEVVKVAFKQGQMVKEGDLLVQIDPRPYQAALDEALAKKAQHEANLKEAQVDLQRYATLAKQDSIARQQLDTQQSMVDQLLEQIKGDQGAIDNAQTQLDYTTIRSPLTGKVGFRLVDPGNIVHATDTTGIVTIVKLQPISVVFTAPEESVSAINKALAAGVVPVSALSSDGLTTLAEGRLALVNNAVDQGSGTIQMKAIFDNADNVLWPGLSVSTRLLINTLKQVVVVPEDAVQRGPNGLYVFVVGDDNKAKSTDVQVGQEGNGQSVILHGLSSGERVVIAGQYRLQQGDLVQPTGAATPNPPEKATPSATAKTP
jgi:membrane fusion protein, multidrug efflux system